MPNKEHIHPSLEMADLLLEEDKLTTQKSDISL